MIQSVAPPPLEEEEEGLLQLVEVGTASVVDSGVDVENDDDEVVGPNFGPTNRSMYLARCSSVLVVVLV